MFIARALFAPARSAAPRRAHRPGVDVRTRHEILHLLADLNADGLAIVLTTHDLNGIAAHLPRAGVPQHADHRRRHAHDGAHAAEVLEHTYGAPMDVLEHAGMPLVVDGRHGARTSPRRGGSPDRVADC